MSRLIEQRILRSWALDIVKRAFRVWTIQKYMIFFVNLMVFHQIVGLTVIRCFDLTLTLSKVQKSESRFIEHIRFQIIPIYKQRKKQDFNIQFKWHSLNKKSYTQAYNPHVYGWLRVLIANLSWIFVSNLMLLNEITNYLPRNTK